MVRTEGPLAKAISVGLVEKRKEKETNDALDGFGQYCGKVYAAVVRWK